MHVGRKKTYKRKYTSVGWTSLHHLLLYFQHVPRLRRLPSHPHLSPAAPATPARVVPRFAAPRGLFHPLGHGGCMVLTPLDLDALPDTMWGPTGRKRRLRRSLPPAFSVRVRKPPQVGAPTNEANKWSKLDNGSEPRGVAPSVSGSSSTASTFPP